MNAAHARRLVAVAVVAAPAVAVRAPVAAPVPAHRRHRAAAAAPVPKAAAIAMTTRNRPAPTPIWARKADTATPATAAQAMAAAVAPSLIPCAPALTAWLNVVAVEAGVIATLEEVVAMAEDPRVAVVVGATGLVGQAVLAALLTAEARDGAGGTPAYAAVHVLHALGRRAPLLNDSRLHLHAVDFSAMPALPPVDDVYITLGTTLAAAGSRDAFRAVDYHAVMATARAARAAGATRCGVVTAMGANAHSGIFYNRVKGEVERDLQDLGFSKLVIARPSLLVGDRRALQQAPRRGESVAIRWFQAMEPLIPASYRARAGADVGRALVHAVQSGQTGLRVLSGNALQAA